MILGGLIDILDFICSLFQMIINIIKKVKKNCCEEKEKENDVKSSDADTKFPMENKEMLSAIKPIGKS